MTKMRQWSIFTAIAVVVVLAAGWLLLVKPQRSHAASLKASAATQVGTNAGLQGQIATLLTEQKSLPQEQQALHKFNTQVPSVTDEPTLLRQLAAAAIGSDVDMVSLTPGTAIPVTSADATAAVDPTATTPATGTSTLAPAATSNVTLMELPLSIAITGSYSNIESYFQSLEKLPRSTLVAQFSLCPEDITASEVGACSGPSSPANKTLPDGSLGATISAEVFFAPPASAASTTTLTPTTGTTTTGTTTTGTTTTGTTTTTTGTTPTTTPTVASTAPAN